MTWTIWHREGPDAHGRYVWRDMGLSYTDRSRALAEIGRWRKAWPHHAYKLRKDTAPETPPSAAPRERGAWEFGIDDFIYSRGSKP
jgi:hypothetical protein